MRKTLILTLAAMPLLLLALGGCNEAPAMEEIMPGLAFVDSVVGTGDEATGCSSRSVDLHGYDRIRDDAASAPETHVAERHRRASEHVRSGCLRVREGVLRERELALPGVQ